MTQFEKVKLFSDKVLTAQGICTDGPTRALSKNEVIHTVEMVVDEITELLATVFNTEERFTVLFKTFIKCDSRDDLQPTECPHKTAIEQLDALIDINYYCLDKAAKVNLPYDKGFDLVSNSNLEKVKNKVILDEKGKVLKPEGWKAPDLAEAFE